MNLKIRILLLSLLCFFCFFINRDKVIPDIMEARNFLTAQEMIEYNNWLEPTLNGEPRLAKPPLPTWITAGWGLIAKDYRSKSLLRIPAALAATLMVFALFFLATEFTKDPLLPFVSSIVLSTCFYFNYMGRINTWDIYCHSFMLTGIWLGIRALHNKGNRLVLFTLAGIMLGFSFLSKGPVSFYTVLLPCIIVYPIFFGFSEIKNSKGYTFYALLLAACIGLAWPAYTYFFQKEVFLEVLQRETAAWAEHHSRPFYHYWSFPAQTGIWALIITFSFAYNYLSSKLEDSRNYKFFFWWAVLALFLLSMIPEKKERYLLPSFIPLSLMAGVYLRYLIHSFKSNTETRWDKIAIQINTILLIIASLALIPLHYFLGVNKELLSSQQFLLIILSSLGIVFFLFYTQAKRNILGYVFSIAGVMIIINIFSLPLVSKPLHNSLYKPFPVFHNNPKFAGLPIYAENDLLPEYLWQINARVTYVRDLVIPGVTTCEPSEANRPVILSFENDPLIEKVHHTLGEHFIYISKRSPDYFLLENYTHSSITLIDTYYPGTQVYHIFYAYLISVH